MVVKKAVHFFYDVISPYSWIGFEILVRHQKLWPSMDLRLRPFYLGGILRGASNPPPAKTVPNKGLYSPKDIARLAVYFGVPAKIPPDFFDVAFNPKTVNAQRFLVAIDQLTGGKQEPLEEASRQLWIRMYNTHKDITTNESLREAGLQADLPRDLVDQAILNINDDKVKKELKRNTDEALEEGAFGSPTIIVHLPDNRREMLFGGDRMHIIADMIGEEYRGPLLQHRSPKLPAQ